MSAAGLDWFLLALCAAIALAWVYPDAGAKGGWLHASALNRAGVALVFFLGGARLPFTELRAGALAWRQHLVVQAFTFLLFPLLGLAILAGAGDALSAPMRTGVMFLCALPSTITSSVALTSAAGANVPLAIFNASLSSALAVVLTPLWLAVALGTAATTAPWQETLASIALWLLLPLAIGQLLRVAFEVPVTHIAYRLRHADRWVIVLLVYTSFCDSFRGGVWSGHGVATPLITVAGSLATFFVMLGVAHRIATRLGFDTPTSRTMALCSSQKSLAVGVPMAQILFGGGPLVSVILLPILIYHPLQLLLSGWVVARWLGRDASAST